MYNCGLRLCVSPYSNGVATIGDNYIDCLWNCTFSLNNAYFVVQPRGAGGGGGRLSGEIYMYIYSDEEEKEEYKTKPQRIPSIDNYWALIAYGVVLFR